MKKQLLFSKYHSNGNDFILIDNINRELSDSQLSKLAKSLCDRHFFIGADGLIALEKRDGFFYMNYFNSDGSASLMCGNGIRCTARFIIDKGLVCQNESLITIKTGSGDKEILVNGNYSALDELVFKVNMGKPIFNCKSLPYSQKQPITVNTSCGSFEAYYVSMGNPHCVIFLDTDIYLMDNFEVIGKEIENNTSLFPEKTNVEFVNIVDKLKINVRIWERGCAETLSCGTGACAASVLSMLHFGTDLILGVSTKGGKLKTEWNKDTDTVFLSGTSTYVFASQIQIDTIL